MSLCRRPIRRIAVAAKSGATITRTATKSFSQQNIYSQLNQSPINALQPQLLGEEQQDNAIFKIYLKRLRQKSDSTVSPSPLAENGHEQNTSTGGSLLYSTIKVYQLKAGTLEKIIECLTNEQGDLDTPHMHILFATYRTYTDTRTLIDALLARYRSVLPASLDMTEDVRQKTLKSLRTAINCLLTAYKEDFRDPPMYSTLTHFLRQTTDRDLLKQGQTLLDGLMSDDEKGINPHSCAFLLPNEVDNNNNSKNGTTTDSLYNQRGFDYNTPWHFLDMSSTIVAQQLTIVDAELLKRVLPHECLSIDTIHSSRRSGHRSSTIHNTIVHFNAIVGRVIATVLKESNELSRSHIIEKWIEIAQELRQLKNFSSLTAILNGLLSGCVHRLNTAWSHVTTGHMDLLNELRSVFGGCADPKQARAILKKEGTAKYADVSTNIHGTLGKKLRHKMASEQHRPAMVGTVPYLGLYLSDLTYIDTAYPNHISIEDPHDSSTIKLINFEKHRKEFEILAQIKLFQSAATAYTTLHQLPRFKTWFDTVRTYTDDQAWELSYQIEPKEHVDNNDQQLQMQEKFMQTYRQKPLKALFPRFPSQVSLESMPANSNEHTGTTTISGGSLRSSPSLMSLDKISLTSNNSSHQQLNHHNHSSQQDKKQPQSRTTAKNIHSNHSRSSSASSFHTSSNRSSSIGYISESPSPTIGNGTCVNTSPECERLIVKVKLATKKELVYKKMEIWNNERTTSVLKKVLDKFCLDPSTYDRYCIEQELPERKIVLLDHCNVFYALVQPPNDELVQLNIREKTRQEREQQKQSPFPGSGHNRTPSDWSTSSAHSR